MYETDQDFMNYCKQIDSSRKLGPKGQLIVNVQSSYNKMLSEIKYPQNNEDDHINTESKTNNGNIILSMIENHIPGVLKTTGDDDDSNNQEVKSTNNNENNETDDNVDVGDEDDEDQVPNQRTEVRRNSVCLGRFEITVVVKAP